MSEMSRANAEQLVKRYGSIEAAARASHVSKVMLANLISKTGLVKKVGSMPASQHRTLQDFRRDNDEAWKIRDGLKRLFAGGVYMTDSEFREAVRGNPGRWRVAADCAEFKENRFRYRGETLWAGKDAIAEMKSIVGMAT